VFAAERQGEDDLVDQPLGDAGLLPVGVLVAERLDLRVLQCGEVGGVVWSRGVRNPSFCSGTEDGGTPVSLFRGPRPPSESLLDAGKISGA
jgi:hypothetical protein